MDSPAEGLIQQHSRGRLSSGRVLHLLYEIGIWFKGIDGILELVGGILFLVVSKSALSGVIATLTQHELVGDSGDWLAIHLRIAFNHLSSSTKLFGSAYLLGHGAVKVFLVWGGLLRCKLWAFPAALLFIGAFVLYQSFRLSYRFSPGLLALTGLDVLVMLLIWREYNVMKRRRT